ncbi:protein-methionine sulfoxide oxidase mical3a-like isoform X1 [Pomacea canaliculata]|uniref:protein-methionine sulfoxide oxidase mical3a-like isoform X1 n=1 Tax=Pomacea canaliculata TaxID=400727 RepID=UPI000D7306ED|nr:protein-methionine sulfoxide oxidase mical3a-like isoform X1 [Pomacea canaliculata]
MFGGRKTSNNQQANLQQESDMEPSLFCGLFSCHKKSRKEEKRDKELETNVSENIQLTKSPQHQHALSQTVTRQSHDAQAGGKVKAMKEKLEKIQSEAEEGVQRKEIKGKKAPTENLQKSPAARTPQKQPQAQGQVVPASELCYFCHKRVYLMERLTAEGFFFHHKCFKCSFCQVELRIINYESERLRDGIVNFYCARHAVPEKRIATGIYRKRPLDRTNTPEENVAEEVKTSEKGEQRSEAAQHKKTTTKAEETKHEPIISLSPAGDDKNKDFTDSTQKKDKKKKDKKIKFKKGKENKTTKNLEESDGVEVADREKGETNLPSLPQLRQALEKLLSKAPKIKTSGADITDFASFLLDEDEKSESSKDQALKKQEKMVTLQQKRAEQQRLFAAQEIQRRLQEIDLHMQELEQQGKQLEKEIRDKGTDYDIKDQAMGKWMNLIKEKNILMRHEAKLVLRAKELELEDTQTRLQLKLNETSKKQDKEKAPMELAEERQIINDLTNVIKQRIALGTQLEDDKHREEDEDQSVEAMMKEKGFLLVPLPYSHQLKLGSIENLASP